MHRRLAFSHTQAIGEPADALSTEHVSRALRNGETDAWQAWIAYHSPQLYSYLVYNTHAEVEAKQLLQSVFLRVTQTILQSEQPFDLKILTVSALYQATVLYQQRCGAPIVSSAHWQQSTDAQQVRFIALLGKLSSIERHLLLLRYIVGLDLAELEKVTGHSLVRVTAILQKAKNHFGALLSE